MSYHYAMSMSSQNDSESSLDEGSSAESVQKNSIQTHEIVSSRHGDLVVVNCFTDGTLKLYDTKMLFEAIKDGKRQDGVTIAVKPRHIFSDPVNTNTFFVSCDFSGDGEYVVGGTNSAPRPGDKYELYVWDTTTGVLLDRLTGPQTILNNVCWHPTRSFIAAATSDGEFLC